MGGSSRDSAYTMKCKRDADAWTTRLALRPPLLCCYLTQPDRLPTFGTQAGAGDNQLSVGAMAFSDMLRGARIYSLDTTMLNVFAHSGFDAHGSFDWSVARLLSSTRKLLKK
jgi:hypothetical protein